MSTQYKVILMMLALIPVSIVVVGVLYTFHPAQQKVSIENKIEAFCPDTLATMHGIFAKESPNTFIAESPDQAYLEAWKEAFMYFNGVTDEYFNEHIRIDSVFSNNEGTGLPGSTRMGVYYYSTYDWSAIKHLDQFLIKLPGADSFLEPAQVTSRIKTEAKLTPRGDRWYGVGTTMYNIQSATMPEKLVTCEDAVEKLQAAVAQKFPDGIITGFYSPLISEHTYQIVAQLSDNCYHASISLVTGAVATSKACPMF